MTTAEATPTPAASRRGSSFPWLGPIVGVVLMAVILLAAPLYGRMTSGGKISADVDRSASTVNVIVDLPFEVGGFHRSELGRFGVYSGRDRGAPSDLSRVRLQNVAQDDLERLANLFWVETIEPA